MLIEQIIEFEFRGSLGPPGRTSTRKLVIFITKKIFQGKSSSELLFPAKILQEAM